MKNKNKNFLFKIKKIFSYLFIYNKKIHIKIILIYIQQVNKKNYINKKVIKMIKLLMMIINIKK